MSVELKLRSLIELAGVNLYFPMFGVINERDSFNSLFDAGKGWLSWVPLHEKFEQFDADFQDVLELARRPPPHREGDKPEITFCWKSTDICYALMILNALPTPGGFDAPTLGYSERKAFPARAENTLHVELRDDAPIFGGQHLSPSQDDATTQNVYLALAKGRCQDVRANSMIASEIAYQRVHSERWLFPSDSSDEDKTVDYLLEQTVPFHKALVLRSDLPDLKDHALIDPPPPRRFITVTSPIHVTLDVTNVLQPMPNEVRRWLQTQKSRYVAFDPPADRHPHSLEDFIENVKTSLDTPW